MAADRKRTTACRVGAVLTIHQRFERRGRLAIDRRSAARQSKRIEVTGAAAHAGQNLRNRKRIAYRLISVEPVRPLNGEFDEHLIRNGGSDISAFRSDGVGFRLHRDALRIGAEFQCDVDSNGLCHLDRVL